MVNASNQLLKKSVKTIELENYTTLNLIEDLRKEISEHSDILSQLFPNNFKYPSSWLSLIWGYNKDYLKNIRNRAIKNPIIRIPDRNLENLKQILIKKFNLWLYQNI